MARKLDRLPERLRIYGIAGRHFAPGTRACVAVARAAAEVAVRIGRELEPAEELP